MQHHVTKRNKSCAYKLQRYRDERRNLHINGTQGKRAGASCLVPLATQQHKATLQRVYIACSGSCVQCVYSHVSCTIPVQGCRLLPDAACFRKSCCGSGKMPANWNQSLCKEKFDHLHIYTCTRIIELHLVIAVHVTAAI